MASYITFDQYTQLGGKLKDESTFVVLEQRARRKLDSITFNNIHELDTIPDEVVELMVLYIDMFETNTKTTSNGLRSYSNGVESFNYSITDDETINTRFNNLAKEYLFNTGLLYRGGASFDNI